MGWRWIALPSSLQQDCIDPIWAERCERSLVTIGLFTRLAAIPIAFGFTVAVFIHHWPDTWSYKELPSLYWASFIIIAILGPGKYSLDELRLRKKNL